MSESSGELADRLRLRHRLDQFFATLDGVQADTHERAFRALITTFLQEQADATVCTVDNDEETRLLVRNRYIKASQEPIKPSHFASTQQEDGVAETISLLSEAYDQDPYDFLVFPTTHIEQKSKRMDMLAAFVTLNSPEGIITRSVAGIQRLRKAIPDIDTGAYNTEERIYQLYASQPQHTIIGATALTGETQVNGLVPVMDYTDAGIHIAASKLIEPGDQDIVFRPGLIVRSNGAIH